MQEISKMKIFEIFLFAFLLFAAGTTNAQLGVGIANPNVSAQLDVTSTSRGFSPPQMTSAKRNAITSLAAGLDIPNTNTNSLEFYTGSTWMATTTTRSTSAPFLPTIVIGTQQWMAKNLDVAFYRNGDPIPQVTDPTAWANLTTGAWCYFNNDPTLGTTYGKLYNWYAVNDPRGLAPVGWHIPTSDEWTILINFLGGYYVAGGKMKESGTTHWISPNIDANNSSGFSGLPGGTWTSLIARFNSLGSAGFWWGSTPVNDKSSTIVGLFNEYGSIGMWNGNNNYGASVRCILDSCSFPVIQCSDDTLINADGDNCGVVLWYNPPVVIEACGTSTIKQITGLASGAFFPVGVTVNRFVAISSSGKTDTCSFTVTVKDTKPPLITNVSASPASLWPPNHQMKDVTINYTTWDNCGTVSSSLSVSSNELVNGTGDGDTSPDWIIVNNHLVKLRAERSGRDNGRVYTITITSTDASGNPSTQTTQVSVPHNSKMDYVNHLFDCKVIPNPSSHYFDLQVNTGSDEKIEVNLYDISGKFLSKMNAANNQALRFGSNLRPGTYMVEVIQGQQRQRLYLIKQ